MAIIIDPNPVPLDGVPAGIDGPPGSELLSAFAYPGYANLLPDDEVNTQLIDWASLEEMDQDQMHQIGTKLQEGAYQNSEDLLAYVLYKATILDISIPQQVCAFGLCWTPPFAGSTIISCFQYRLWSLTRPVYVPAANPYMRPLAPLLVLIIGGILISFILTIVGVIAMQQGRIKFSDLRDTVHEIISAPGENIAKPISAAFWPLAALGISMVGAAIIFPIAMSKVSVSAPLGPARVTAGVEAGRRGGGRR